MIKKLPNVLILHLNRISFNMQTYENVKIPDRFEFPKALNMFDSTKQGVKASESLKLDSSKQITDDLTLSKTLSLTKKLSLEYYNPKL
jgi:hypothetical protein